MGLHSGATSPNNRRSLAAFCAVSTLGAALVTGQAARRVDVKPLNAVADAAFPAVHVDDVPRLRPQVVVDPPAALPTSTPTLSSRSPESVPLVPISTPGRAGSVHVRKRMIGAAVTALVPPPKAVTVSARLAPIVAEAPSQTVFSSPVLALAAAESPPTPVEVLETLDDPGDFGSGGEETDGPTPTDSTPEGSAVDGSEGTSTVPADGWSDPGSPATAGPTTDSSATAD
jgi:hypothetical protein